MAARPSPALADVWPWPEVVAYFTAEHELGEHVVLLGRTGGGKTTLSVELLIARGTRRASDGRPTRIAILETKRRDKTMQPLLSLGWKRITKPDEWPPQLGDEHTIVWPVPGKASSGWAAQKPLYVHVLDEVDESGNQIVYLDEVADFTDYEKDGGLGLAGMLSRYWRAQRSNGVSLFATTQRPANVPRIMWDSASWLILFRPRDLDDLKRVGELGGNKELVLEIVPHLRPFEFLMLHDAPGSPLVPIVSKVELR